MKTSELTKLGKILLPALPGFALRGKLLLLEPLGHTLRGIFFAGSIDPRSFYVQVFLQPLFVPANHFVFNVGWRLGGESHSWKADEPRLQSSLTTALQREALPFLSRVQSLSDVVLCAQSLRESGDPYVQQAIAYSFARNEDIVQATDALTALIELLKRRGDYAWQHEMARRAASLKKQLQDAPSDAQRMLEGWESDTAKKLGLEEYR